MNNFQKLESQKLDTFDESTRKVKKNVDKSMDLYRFVGNIFDLYFPKIVGFMNAILGGETDDNRAKSKYPNKQ